MANYECITCDPCDAQTMPTVEFDPCEPHIGESEICDLIIGLPDPDNPGQMLGGPVDLTDPAAIDAALTAGTIIILTGIGDLPEPEQDVQTGPKRLKIFGKKTFLLNFTIMDMNQTNYDFIRKMECNGIYHVAYADIDGGVFGGDHGIRAQCLKAFAPKDRGENTYNRGELQFEWFGRCHPPRAVYGLGEDYVEPVV